MSRNTAWFWFDRFRNGNTSLQDQLKSGRPATIDLDELKQAIESDPTLSTSNVANKLSCTKQAVHYHFMKLRLVSKLGDKVPHELNEAQKNKRVEVCKKLLSLHRTQHWLDKLITEDEKWVLHANIERKRQWLKPDQKAKHTP